MAKTIFRLDSGLAPGESAALLDWIRDHYASTYEVVPLGFVAICYLGPPYIEHQLDLGHSIVEHFEPGRAMAAPFESARPLVRSGAYSYIEVHSDGMLIPVLPNGATVCS